MATFITFPNEILLLFADNLPKSDLNALLQTNRKFLHLLYPALYKLALTAILPGGINVLHWAARNRVKTTALSLLERGADIEAQVCWTSSDLRYGFTALHHAVKNGHEELARLLLDRGARLESRVPIYNDCVLRLAVESGNERVLELLIERGANYAVRFNGRSVLRAAASVNIKMVRVLFEKGAAIDSIRGDWGLGLLDAVRAEKLDIIKFLVDKGADINGICTHLRPVITPLHEAVEIGSIEVSKFLVDSGADINGIFNHKFPGTTPLHRAIDLAHEVLAMFLVGRGASINIPGRGGTTTLYKTAFRENDRLLKFLLDSGAEVNPPGPHIPYHPIPIKGEAEYYDQKILIEFARSFYSESMIEFLEVKKFCFSIRLCNFCQ